MTERRLRSVDGDHRPKLTPDTLRKILAAQQAELDQLRTRLAHVEAILRTSPDDWPPQRHKRPGQRLAP